MYLCLWSILIGKLLFHNIILQFEHKLNAKYTVSSHLITVCYTVTYFVHVEVAADNRFLPNLWLSSGLT